MTARVELGFFSFTEVTDPSEHRSYNEWHQLDHMPQQYEIPGIVHGERWVSTPECKAARVFENDRLACVHYMTLYLMSAPLEQTLAEFSTLGASLRSVGRFHEQRRSMLSGPFDLVGTRVAPRALISAQVVPFRPNLGVYVIVDALSAADGDDDHIVSLEERDERFEQREQRLMEHPSVAGIWSFVSASRYRGFGWHPGARRVTVCYLDEAPLQASKVLGDIVRELAPEGTAPQLAGPFDSVVPWRWDWFGR